MENFFTWELAYKIITAFVASVAFAVILRINRRHLLLSGVGAAITFFVYALANALIGSLFAAAFISTLVATLYAEVLARLRRAPTIVYTLTGVIPTVPGGDLYHAMRSLLMNDNESAITYFVGAIYIGLGIAGGIFTMSILFGITLDLISFIKKKLIYSKKASP